MEDKLDLISIFELLDTHKKTRKGGPYFFISFTGIIFGCLEVEAIDGFEEIWSSEIRHGGKMGRSAAKDVYTRERNLYKKYRYGIENAKTESDQISSEINEQILKYVEKELFYKELKEKIEKDNSIPADFKKELLQETEVDTFLSAVLIYEVMNGWKVKKDKTKKNEVAEIQDDSFSNSVTVEENLPIQLENETDLPLLEEKPTVVTQLIVLPEEMKDKKITYSKFDNPTFTIEEPASYVVFNSITNNPNIGDERNFVAVREDDSISKWQEHIVVEKDKEYKIRMYVHNNASSSELIATNVKAMFNLPSNYAKSLTVSGILESDNALPDRIWDSATFVSNELFCLDYVKGSALYENNAFGKNGTIITDDVVTGKGSLLGYDKLNGEIPGCFQYSGYLTISVKPIFAPKAEYTIDQKVRLVNSDNQTWQDSVFASANDEIEHRISFKNTGQSKLNDVMILVNLPEDLSYVDNSTILYNTTNPKGLKIKNKLWTGINIGGYRTNGNAYLYYRTKVADNYKENTLIKLPAKVDAGHGTKKYSVDVILK